MSKAERLLSYSLLSLITATPLAAPNPSASTSGEVDGEANEGEGDATQDDDAGESGKSKGLVNEEGAWCWQEGCHGGPQLIFSYYLHLFNLLLTECLHLTKALQKTAAALQNVADLYDDHVSWPLTMFVRYSCHLFSRPGVRNWLPMKHSRGFHIRLPFTMESSQLIAQH